MPPPLSAGILLFRRDRGGIEILLVKPGGPFWRNKDAGAWMIPKGLVEPGEAPGDAALREFEEELGVRIEGAPFSLCRLRQSGGKWVEAFAVEGEVDCGEIRSNSFDLEWPPRSGKVCSFPEVDAARWLTVAEAREMMLPSQLPILDALVQRLSRSDGD